MNKKEGIEGKGSALLDKADERGGEREEREGEGGGSQHGWAGREYVRKYV